MKTSNQKYNKIMQNVALVFIFIQPVLDIYMGVVGSNFDIFGFSLVTIIRIGFVVLSLAYCFLKKSERKADKVAKYVIVSYVAMVLLYTGLHHFNMMGENYYSSNGLYKPLLELNYIFRITLPIVIIYVLYSLKIDLNKMFRAIICSGLIIAIVIIVSNVFMFSYCSYNKAESDPNENQIILGNIFDWFGGNEYEFEELASRGLFDSANQIGGVLCMAMLITCYMILKEPSKLINYLILFAVSISTLMLGTRLAVYAALVFLIFLLILSIVRILYYRNKDSLLYFIVSICIFTVIFIIYLYSPITRRKGIDYYKSEYAKDIQSVETVRTAKIIQSYLNNDDAFMEYLNVDRESFEEAKKNYLSSFILKNYKNQYISEAFIERIYPYYDDPEFWIDVFTMPFEIKADSRSMETNIVSRIKSSNDNILDTILGMGATQIQERGFMIENDVVAHYFQLGILGILLFIAPYIIALLFIIVKEIVGILHKEKKVSGDLIITIVMVLTIFIIGYNTGHIIDEYIVMIYIASFVGIALNTSVYEGDCNENKSIDNSSCV